ncbi:MAG: alpha/beta hydrolase [Oscillospiraceae bacterium]|nr:alpha/beta hydrolase [Oscillospiraceae bacterium]
MKAKFRKDLEFVRINGHRLHIFRCGDESKPKLVFMSGSGTVAPMYDFKVLYKKLLDDFRIIVIEKFGYGYSELYECPCDIDSVVSYQKQALEMIGEKAPYILLPHSMSGIEAIRWKQMYPDDIKAMIGLDMATPLTYMEWSDKDIKKRIDLMQKLKKLNDHGLMFWYPVNKRSLSKDEIQQLDLLKRRNLMNRCYVNEARQVKKNAKIVVKSGKAECPTLMFVSDGKQTSPNWIKNSQKYAKSVNAETVLLDCGHYIHYYESDKISSKIKAFLSKLD